MALASFDTAEIFRRMRPVLARMDKTKDQLLARFRPVMAIFFCYGAICFMVPYTNLVSAGNRGGLFYFLLISGGLAFSVVLLLYYRQSLELNIGLRRQFVQGMTIAFGPGVTYQAKADEMQFPQDINTFLGAFHGYQVRNLVIGKFPLGHLSTYDFKAFRKPEDFFRSTETVFDGRFYMYEFPLRTPSFWLVPKTLGPLQLPEANEPGLVRELTRRYAIFPPEAEQFEILRDPEVNEVINRMSEEVKKDGLTKHDLALRFSENQMIMALQENRSFLETFNWQPMDREDYVTLQLRPMNLAAELIALLLSKYRREGES